MFDVLFRPAEWLSTRFRFRSKLVGSFLLFALPLVFLISWMAWGALHEIRLSSAKRSALDDQVAALGAMSRLQGQQETEDERKHRFGLVLAELARRPGFLALSGHGRIGDGNGPAGEAAATAQDLRDAVNRLRQSAAEESGLLRNEDETERLHAEILVSLAPRLLVLFGDAADRGAEAIAAKRLRGRDRAELAAVRSGIDPTMVWVRESVERLGIARPAAREPMEAAYDRLNTSRLALQEYLTTKLLDSIDFDVEPAEYRARAAAASDSVAAFAAGVASELGAIYRERQRDRERQALLVLVVFGGLLLMIAYLFSGAYRSIVRSVGRLDEVATAMASGDLTVRVRPEGADEIAEIGRCFNRVAESFEALIGKVDRAVGATTMAVQSLDTETRGVMAASASQRESVLRSSASVQDLAVSVVEVADHAAGTGVIVTGALEKSSHGRRSVDLAVAEMRRVVEEIRGTVRSVEELEERSSLVEKVAATIAGIAEQTNLLALNAAIEAARAGESGRGFAVVADEVRKLAEKTRQSTREIETTIQGIRSGIESVAEGIRAGNERVVSGVATVSALSVILGDIHHEVSRSSALMQEIVAATRAQRDASDGIAREIEIIATNADANRAAVDRTAAAMRELLAVSQGLQAAVADAGA